MNYVQALCYETNMLIFLCVRHTLYHITLKKAGAECYYLSN